MSSGPNHDVREITRYIENDSLTMKFTAKDLDSSLDIKDLTGGDVDWELRPRSQYFEPVLSDTDSGVSLTITDESDGEFEIDINRDVTDQLRGRNVQVISITDSNDDESTATGVLTIVGIGPEV